MARSRAPRTPAPTRKHLARAQRERMLQRWLWGGVIGVAALVLGVLGFGYADQNIIKPRQPLAVVGGVPITTGEFQKSVRYERLQLIQQYRKIQQTLQFFANDPNASVYYQSSLNQIVNQLNSPEALGENVLDSLIDDELVRQEAARRGIAVSSDEVEARLQSFFGYYPEGTPTLRPSPTSASTSTPVLSQRPTTEGTAEGPPAGTGAVTATQPSTGAVTAPQPTAEAPTPTPYTTQAYGLNRQTYFKQLADEIGMTEADYLRRLEAEIYHDKVFEALTADLPREQDQVHARHILVQDRATAEALIVKLQQGQDFAALAQEFSTDQSNKDRGGDLGWFGPGYMVLDFEKIVFNAPVGLVPQPVETQFGFHVVEVLAHEMHAMTEPQYAQQRLDYFNKWLAEQRSGDGVTKYDLWKERVPAEPSLPTTG